MAAATEAPAAEERVKLEFDDKFISTHPAQRGWSDFLKKYPYNETEARTTTLDDYHNIYLGIKLKSIEAELAKKTLVEPPDIDAKVAKLKEAMTPESEEKYHIPNISCDYSYADWRIITEGTAHVSSHPYLDYLNRQKPLIEGILKQVNDQKAIKEQSPKKTSTQLESNSGNVDAANTILKNTRKRLGYIGLTIATLGFGGLAIVFSGFLPDEISNVSRRVGEMLRAPQATLSVPSQDSISPTPNIDTPSTLEAPTLIGSGEGGDEPPKDVAKYVKYSETLYNNADHVANIDYLILGGVDGNQTAAIKQPNVNASRALEFPNPKAILHYDPSKGWTILIPENIGGQTITVINNPQGPDGLTITKDTQNSIYPTNWVKFDPENPETGGEYYEWARQMTIAVSNREVYYPKNERSQTADEKGPVIFYHGNN